MSEENPNRRLVTIGILSTIGVAAIAIPSLRKTNVFAPQPEQTDAIGKNTAQPTQETSSSATENVDEAKLRTASHDPNSYSLLVNKKNSLQPQDYAPTDLRQPNIQLNGTGENMLMRETPATALEKMASAAAQQNIGLKVVSAYRSYQTQIQVYDQWVAQYGKDDADIRSARPGSSEHQTGLAVDVGQADGVADLNQEFGVTPAGKWVAEHCAEFGFIVRYPEGKQDITGYMYEPWHLRYVGNDIAKDMKAKGITTLEEYFNQPAAKTY